MADAYYERVDRMFGERDGRLQHRKIGEKYGTAGPILSQLWEPCFCFNCGTPGGYVNKGTPIVYVCQLCSEKYGHLPLPMVPGTEDL